MLVAREEASRILKDFPPSESGESLLFFAGRAHLCSAPFMPISNMLRRPPRALHILHCRKRLCLYPSKAPCHADAHLGSRKDSPEAKLRELLLTDAPLENGFATRKSKAIDELTRAHGMQNRISNRLSIAGSSCSLAQGAPSPPSKKADASGRKWAVFELISARRFAFSLSGGCANVWILKAANLLWCL